MNRRQIGCAFLSAAMAFGMSTHAAMQAQVARQTGTGSIVGVVTDDGATPKPVRNVTVTANGSGLLFGRSTTTDGEGRFAIGSLPPGDFTVEARKLGFARAYAGSKRPGIGPGSAVHVDGGQRASVTLRMARTSVIAGTVRMPAGAPAVMARVQALRFTTANGERRLAQSTGSWSVDERGEYRIYGLIPGDYVIAVTPAPNTFPEVRTISAEEMQWALRQFQPNAPAVPPPAPASSSSANVGVSPVYFPGTADAAGATAITLKAGEERAGVDVSLTFVPTARIEGTILDAEGQPARNVEARLVTGDSFAALGPGNTIRPGPDGRFSLNAIAPGRYRLFARGSPASAPPTPRPAPGTAPVPPVLPLWLLQDLNVNGADLLGLTMRMQPGLRVTGRVAIEGDGAAAVDLSRVRVTMSAVQRSGDVTVGVGPVQANANGSFSFDGIVPGLYRVSATGAAGWTLKSSVSGEWESQDVGVDVAVGRELPEVVVTLTNRPTEISGAFVDASGRPAPDYHVIAFSTDPHFWVSGSWRVVQARPGTNGVFRIVGLPPGEYWMGAVSDIEANQIYDPALLDQLRAAAVKITLTEGEKKTQNLRISGGSAPSSLAG